MLTCAGTWDATCLPCLTLRNTATPRPNTTGEPIDRNVQPFAWIFFLPFCMCPACHRMFPNGPLSFSYISFVFSQSDERADSEI